MAYQFSYIECPPGVEPQDWNNWRWQFKNALRHQEDFAKVFSLSVEEKKGFSGSKEIFQIRTTPYYAEIARRSNVEPADQDPIRRILMPHADELTGGHQSMLDPLGERKNSPTNRIVHRYTDRVLFLITDFCSVYCRFCTRKHFTGQHQALIGSEDYKLALDYIRTHKEIREVILSGGDPLSVSDEQLDRILTDLRGVEHVDIIRVGSRMPVVAPMRITDELVRVLRKANPVFFMTHFSHPREITAQAAEALTKIVDAGIPVMNQFVLLNGVNNHPRIVEALSRRLLSLRVKPYYMFQCDPSFGTDHLRTSVENSMWIQRELWGRMSGLAMPVLSLDIPNGGGKVSLVPDFEVRKNDARQGSDSSRADQSRSSQAQPRSTSAQAQPQDASSRAYQTVRTFRGWDGVEADYISPPESSMRVPPDIDQW